ncbi:MAG: Hsp33 family molecular chaperone HslO [Ruminococcaceae bacterium]|nr:Hsp33 family molecular chaperone HslO [Oscillospiraceae bacterium]
MSDILLRGNSMDGAIRVFVAITTDLVNEAQRIHHSYPVATAALGRTLTAAAIMGAGLKNETDSITIQFRGNGPLGNMYAVTDAQSRVRGYAVNPFVDLPLNKKGKLDVGGAVGKGQLNVIRDLGMKEPYIGQVPIVTGEIAEDLTYYYAASEQIPTAISLGVLVGTDNRAICAGGLMLQLMPEATEELAAALEDKVRTLPPITQMLADGMSAEEILFSVTEGFDMLMDNNAVTPVYHCPCSMERMEKALISIGRQELEDLIREQGEAELTCQFCDNKFTFSKEHLERLLREAK